MIICIIFQDYRNEFLFLIRKVETRIFRAEKYFYFTPTQHGQSRLFLKFVAIHDVVN